MAIGTDSAVEFFGTQDDLDSTSASVADGAFSIATDVAQWTNDDDAPAASITLLCDWNTTGPDANSIINLYAKLHNVQSTNDGEVPDANHRHVYIGAFPLNDVLTNQYITIDVALPNYMTSSVYEFFIENRSGQTLQAGWILYVTPKTIGPHA